MGAKKMASKIRRRSIVSRDRDGEESLMFGSFFLELNLGIKQK